MQRKAKLVAKTPLKAKTTLRASKPLKKVSKKPTKQKKPAVSKLKKEADKYFSKYVRLRDGNECITCGTKTGQMQNGHFMSRRYNATRFEEENCNSQCYRCNVLFYGEQFKYAQAIDLKYGDGTAVKLAKMAAEPHPFTIEELQEIIHDSREQIAFYGNNA